MLEAEIAVSIGAFIAGSTAFVYGTRKAIGVLRKGIVVHDTIVGRPERYPNDPEAKPGFVERFDRSDAKIDELGKHIDKIDAKTDELGKRVEKIEQYISSEDVK